MSHETPDKPRVAVGLSMKVNLGNYQSAEINLHVSGLTEDATPEEVAALLDGPGRIAFDAARDRLRTKVNEVMKEHAR